MKFSFVATYLPTLSVAMIAAGAIFAYGFYRLGEMEKKSGFYDFALSEIGEALSAADRVLRSKHTPPIIRQSLLVMLMTLGEEKLRRVFMRKFHLFMDNSADRLGGDSVLAEAIEDLRGYDAELATDAHTALMGMALLAIPLAQDSGADVLPYLSKAATNPGMVLGRMVNAAPHFLEENSLGGAVALTY